MFNWNWNCFMKLCYIVYRFLISFSLIYILANNKKSSLLNFYSYITVLIKKIQSKHNFLMIWVLKRRCSGLRNAWNACAYTLLISIKLKDIKKNKILYNNTICINYLLLIIKKLCFDWIFFIRTVILKW